MHGSRLTMASGFFCDAALCEPNVVALAASTPSRIRLTDTVLSWLTSFVTGRSLQVVCKGQLSTSRLMEYGVSRGQF